ncbi:uncharacterized protein LOC135482827 isoform X2 [Lineus longissimus]|uniref:uncharacterized protein LOC135482827 isoform X2 n=1 Tax=Lineus longissimus TaxID=88925 RepID=UPI002B4EE328
MALVTVQRSPTPSTTPESEPGGSGEDQIDASNPQSRSRSSDSSQSSALRKLKRACNTVRFVSKLRLSESYLAVKGAALILPQSECYRRVTKGSHGGDIQSHLQSMFYLLRPQDTIKIAVKLESALGRNRYLALVACFGRQDTEESLILGIDISDKTTIGMVLPIWADMTIKLDGDGGFIVTSSDRSYILKPVSVQAMWSALQSLHKALEISRTHYYFAGGLTHTWLGYYESKISSDRHAINEWNTMEDILSPKSDKLLLSEEDKDSLEFTLRTKLKEVMMTVDLEEATSKQIRTQVEETMGMDLREYRSFIDQEILLIFGQMDSPSKIFDYLYLGSEWNASNLEELKDNGVGYILNVTREIDNFFHGMFDYMNIRVFDVEESDLLKYWEKTYKFIRKAKDQGSKCLVHCKMGISRSASTVIAYAMKEYNWTLQETLRYVKEKRSCINPNRGFRAQLQTYQGILDASNQRNNLLWKSKSDQDLKKSLLEEEADIADRLFYEEHGMLSPSLHNRPQSWGPESKAYDDDIVMAEPATGKSITEQILAAKYADLPQSFVSSSFGFEKDIEISSRSADSMEEYFPDIPTPMETDSPEYGPDEDVTLLSFRSYVNPDELAETLPNGAMEGLKVEKWDGSSSETSSETAAGFYNCLKLLSADGRETLDSGTQKQKGDKSNVKKILPDGSWIREVPPSPEVPYLIDSGEQSVEAPVFTETEEKEILMNSGIVQKQKHGYEELLKQKGRKDGHVRTASGGSSECEGDNVSDYSGSDEKINFIVPEHYSNEPDRPRVVSLGDEGMDLLTESTTDDCDVSPKGSGISPRGEDGMRKGGDKGTTQPDDVRKDADSSDQPAGESSEDKEKRTSVIYESENIALSPGLVRRTMKELEQKTKTQVAPGKSPRPARRAESLKERPMPKTVDEERRKTVAFPVLQNPCTGIETASSEGSSSPRSNSFRPTPDSSPIVSRRKKAKMSLKVDEDADVDADEDDENDPEKDSFLVFNLGDEEVVVKKGKVKRRTMDFEQLQGDLDKLISETKSDGEEVQKPAADGADSQGSGSADESVDHTSGLPDMQLKAQTHDIDPEQGRSKDVLTDEECPLPRGTVKLHKQKIEHRMSDPHAQSPVSPTSPQEKLSGSPPTDSVFGNFPSSSPPPSDTRPDPVPLRPVAAPGAILRNDELPVAGIVKQHKEMIENRHRESFSDVVPETDIDESVRMNKETLKLICQVGESLLNSPRDSEASSTDEDRLRLGFVRKIARELELKGGVYDRLQKVVIVDKTPLIPFGSEEALLSPELRRQNKLERDHGHELKRLGSLPDMRQRHPSPNATNRPSSLCIEPRAVHSAGEEDEVILRRQSVGPMNKTAQSSSKPQRQVKSLVDKFETPSTSPKGLSPSRMETEETVVSPTRDLPASPECGMDISPEPSPSASFNPEPQCASSGAEDEVQKGGEVSSKPPLPSHSLGTCLSPRKVRKHHGKSHPLEKLSGDTPPAGRTNNPLYNTM